MALAFMKIFLLLCLALACVQPAFAKGKQRDPPTAQQTKAFTSYVKQIRDSQALLVKVMSNDKKLDQSTVKPEEREKDLKQVDEAIEKITKAIADSKTSKDIVPEQAGALAKSLQDLVDLNTAYKIKQRPLGKNSERADSKPDPAKTSKTEKKEEPKTP